MRGRLGSRATIRDVAWVDPRADQSLAPELQARVEAVEAFISLADRLFEIHVIEWSAVEDDWRLLAINGAFRRQLESITAAILLTKQGLGHLSVTFVRAALEDVMYLRFFLGLDRIASQRLFTLLGRWDGFRSLLSQRNFVGDEVMNDLWYSTEFLDAAEDRRNETRDALKELQKQYRWRGGIVPSADWIAERAGQREFYDYLHAATSRALHFSAGEMKSAARLGQPDRAGDHGLTRDSRAPGGLCAFPASVALL